MRLAYITRALGHYRLPVLAELSNRGVACRAVIAGSGRARFPSTFSGVHPDVEVVDTRQRGFRWRGDVLRALEPGSWDAMVIEHGASLDFAWTLLLSRRFARIPRVLWSHGIDRREYFSGSVTLAGHGRWRQLRLSDGVICYDRMSAERLMSRLPRMVVGVAPNSTDGTALLTERRLLERTSREDHRRRLGLPCDHYAVTLGRLIPDKEFTRSVHVIARLRARGLDVGLIVIGDGPDEAAMREAAERAGLHDGTQIRFAGAVTDPPRLAEILYAADLCLNPGYLGLSVVDCLFSGVPVLSVLPGNRGPYHSPEWVNVIEGQTGWLAREDSDEAMARLAIEYFSRPADERRHIESNCMAYAERSLGVRPMVDGFLDTLSQVQNAGAP